MLLWVPARQDSQDQISEPGDPVHAYPRGGDNNTYSHTYKASFLRRINVRPIGNI